jgi:type II secretory pathway pseudopilin PulG
MSRWRRKTKGTTPAEVVVITAITGLLLSVLAPTLTHARQQSRVAKCLANLRAITQAAAGYIGENDSLVFAYPWDYMIDGFDPSIALATEFIWGGGVPDKTWAEWDCSQGHYNPPHGRHTDTYAITPANRPLNAYMCPAVWWDDPLRIKPNPERYKRPMLLPDVFQCPSDSTAHTPGAMGTDPNLPDGVWYPTWQWWGTSYAINWYWGYYYSIVQPLPLIGTTDNPGVLDGPLHREILQSKREQGASEWPLFYENRLNFALEDAVPRGYEPQESPKTLSGWHGEQDVHAAGFLDGSARYRHFNARYVDGPGWTLWPNRPWDEYWAPYQDY